MVNAMRHVQAQISDGGLRPLGKRDVVRQFRSGQGGDLGEQGRNGFVVVRQHFGRCLQLQLLPFEGAIDDATKKKRLGQSNVGGQF